MPENSAQKADEYNVPKAVTDQMEEPMEPMQDVEAREDQTKLVLLAIYALVVVSGATTGYLLSRFSGKLPMAAASSQKTGAVINNGKVAGISDTRTFKDSATGTIDKGGLNGEGTHKLIRDGGPSQTVYLVSSAVDLDQYVGKKVTVWGQTMAAKKVAWLMDVGKIELQ